MKDQTILKKYKSLKDSNIKQMRDFYSALKIVNDSLPFTKSIDLISKEGYTFTRWTYVLSQNSELIERINIYLETVNDIRLRVVVYGRDYEADIHMSYYKGLPLMDILRHLITMINIYRIDN